MTCHRQTRSIPAGDTSFIFLASSHVKRYLAHPTPGYYPCLPPHSYLAYPPRNYMSS